MPTKNEYVFIISFAPTLCPNCGYKFKWTAPGALGDFFAGAGHTCPQCETKFQYVAANTITETARKVGGDL